MNQSKIAVRYAKALFDFVKEDNLLDKIAEDLNLLTELFQNGDFINMIKDPVIRTSKKQEVLHEIVKDKIHAKTISFVNLLFTNKREVYLPDIARNYKQLYLTEKNLKYVILTSAIELKPEIHSEIQSLFQNAFKSKIKMIAGVDKKIIGGFILQVDDLLIDASVSTKLRKIKEKFMNVPLTK